MQQQKETPDTKINRELPPGQLALTTSFFNLLFGSAKIRRRDKALRKITKNLTAHGYLYIKRNALQPQFAQQLYDVYRFTARARLTFSRYSSPESCTTALLRAAVSDQIRRTIDNTDESVIRKKAETLSWNTVYEEVKSNLTLLKRYFTPDTVKYIDDVCKATESYRRFCFFDFYQMLKLFDPSMRENDFSTPPTFSPVQSDRIFEMIGDLEMAFRQFLSIGDLSMLRPFFIETGNDPVEEEKQIIILNTTITAFEENRVLESLCRIISQNPDLSFPEAPSVPSAAIESIKKIFISAEETVESLLEERRKLLRQTRSAKLFGKDLPKMLDNYSPTFSAKLSCFNLSPFKYAEPLGYCRGFIKQFISEKYKTFSDTLTIRGNCLDADFMKEVRLQYEELETVQNLIEKFDFGLSPTSTNGYKISFASKNIPVSHETLLAAQRIIDAANGTSCSLLHRAMKTLPAFSKNLKKMSEDHSESFRKIIDNWEAIDRFIEYDSKKFLDDLSDKTAQLSELIMLYLPAEETALQKKQN